MAIATTDVGRLKVPHPNYNEEPTGSDLHTAVRNAWTRIADHMNGRFFIANNLADSASVDMDHNFKDAFSNLEIMLFLRNESTGELTRLDETTAPKRSEFAIIPKGGSLTTVITVTNNSGAERDIAVIVKHGRLKYPFIFNATTAWTGPSGGFYTLTLTEAKHDRGIDPTYSIWEKDGSDYKPVDVGNQLVNSSGDIIIKVPDTPDSRFEGKLIVQ